MRHGTLLPLLLAIASHAAALDWVPLVPPDSVYVTYINVDRIRTSPSFSFYLSWADPRHRHFRDVAESAGIQLRSDIREVIVAEDRRAGRVVILRGNLAHASLAAFPRGWNEMHQEIYRGIPILTEEAQDPTEAIATARVGNAVTIAPKPTLHAAIDRIQRPVGSMPWFAPHIEALQSRYDAWIVFRPGPGEVTAFLNPPVDRVAAGFPPPAVRFATFGIRLGFTVNVEAEISAETASGASLIGNRISALLPLLRLAPNAGTFGELLAKMRIYTERDHARASLTLTSEEFDDLLAAVSPPFY